MYIFSESTIKASTESTDLQALIGRAIFPLQLTDLCDMDKQERNVVHLERTTLLLRKHQSPNRQLG